MLAHMKQLLVEIDDEMAARLERFAPVRSRRRSEFIRQALRKALWDVEEAQTAKAYRRKPDAPETLLDPQTWEAPAKSRARRKPR